MKYILILISIVFLSQLNSKAQLGNFYFSYNTSIKITNADYIVLRYNWTSNDGKDLDTATRFVSSGVSGLDGNAVGWYLNSNVLNILKYGGDNTSSGDETVLIDLSVLKSKSGLNEQSTIQLYSNWYNQSTCVYGWPGNILIELKAYVGGTMSQSGFQWVNSGGTLIQTNYITKKVTTCGSSNVLTYDSGGYIYLGYVYYYKSTSQIVFKL